jgi:hypothetical protein
MRQALFDGDRQAGFMGAGVGPLITARLWLFGQ